MQKIESSVQHGEKSVPHAKSQTISQQFANLQVSQEINLAMSVWLIKIYMIMMKMNILQH